MWAAQLITLKFQFGFTPPSHRQSQWNGFHHIRISRGIWCMKSGAFNHSWVTSTSEKTSCTQGSSVDIRLRSEAKTFLCSELFIKQDMYDNIHSCCMTWYFWGWWSQQGYETSFQPTALSLITGALRIAWAHQTDQITEAPFFMKIVFLYCERWLQSQVLGRKSFLFNPESCSPNVSQSVCNCGL